MSSIHDCLLPNIASYAPHGCTIELLSHLLLFRPPFRVPKAFMGHCGLQKFKVVRNVLDLRMLVDAHVTLIIANSV